MMDKYEVRWRWHSIMMIAGVVMMLPGCIKYHKTLPTEFPQGIAKENYGDIASQYVRSSRVYEQFNTQALFDAIWLSNNVRMAYAKLYCEKRGKSSEDTEAFLTRQLEENKHWVTFYVLSEVRDGSNTALSDKDAAWTFYLTVGGYTASPESIKEVELEPEYQAFFGKRYNHFKTAYLVKFPLHDVAGKHKVQPGSAVTLVAASVNKQARMVWASDTFNRNVNTGKARHNEDFYWG